MDGGLLIIITFVSIVLLVVGGFSAIFFINKKQINYVNETSYRINEIKELNEEYKKQFGCLSSCDISMIRSFKTKQSFDSFCNNSNKIAKEVLEYEDEIIQSFAKILKNKAFIDLYRTKIKEIQNASDRNFKMRYMLSHNRYLSIEKKQIQDLILKPPLDFVLTIKAHYVSPKGRSEYVENIKCHSNWMLDVFTDLKNKDLLVEANSLNIGEAKFFESMSHLSNDNNCFADNDYDRATKNDSKYLKLLDMSYREVVNYLLEEYGPVPGDYFLKETCKSRNRKISRANEGIFVHHIDEDKAIMLSNEAFAIKNPYSYQRADRLVYCDILEHLILHVKISEEPRNPKANEFELPGIGGAVNLICVQINDCYGGYNYTQPMMLNAKEMIKDCFDDYIVILKRLRKIIDNNPLYSDYRDIRLLCLGCEGNVVRKVYNALL